MQSDQQQSKDYEKYSGSSGGIGTHTHTHTHTQIPGIIR